MLDRVAKTKAVLERNERHKDLLEKTIDRQRHYVNRILPLISPRSGVVDADALHRTGSSILLKFAEQPSADIVDFAFEVGEAWDNTGIEERLKLAEEGLIIKAFCHPGDASAFFSVQEETTMGMGSLGTLISTTRDEQDKVWVYSRFEDFLSGRMESQDQLRELFLTEKNITVGALVAIYPNRIMAVINAERISIPNVRKSRIEYEERVAHGTMFIARRMSLGFNPLL